MKGGRQLLLKAVMAVLSTSYDDPGSTVGTQKCCLDDGGSDAAAMMTAKETALDEMNRTKLQEIMNVKVTDQVENDDPLLRNYMSLLDSGDSFYVAFHNPEEGVTGDDEESLLLKSVGKSGRHWEAPVNLHVPIDTPLQADVYRRLRGLPDRKIGTATFSPKLLNTDTYRCSVHEIVKDRNGKPTRTAIELDIRKKNLLDIYVRKRDIKEDRRGGLQIFFKVVSKVLDGMIKSSKNPPARKLEPPLQEPNKDLKFVEDLDGLLVFPSDGEFVSLEPGHTTKMKLMNRLPFDDRNNYFKNLPDAIKEIRNIVKNNVKRPPEGFWNNVTGDESMHRVYFSSLGMYLIEKIPSDEDTKENTRSPILSFLRRVWSMVSGQEPSANRPTCDHDHGFVSDTTFLTNFTYRPGYEPLGCLTYFDNVGNITKIVDGCSGKEYFPDDGIEWEWAKLKSRTSAFSIMSLIHVTDAHVTYGNVPGTAMRMYLNCEHPIRRAFSVHFYKTAYTVTQAHHALFAERGVLHRSLPMEYEGGLKDAFIDLFKNFKFERFPDFIKDRGLDDCEFHVAATDGIELHNIISKYVGDFLDYVYPAEDALQEDTAMKNTYMYMVQRIRGLPPEYNLENMKTVFSEILFRVTGWHSSIGNVSMYALNPSLINIRLKALENETFVSPKEAAIGVAMIVAVTTVDCPRLSQDWRQVFRNPSNIPYNKLRLAMAKFESSVNRRNKKRFENVDFHPKNAALSITS
mmetsp:Transcript_56641/g.137598  ORF Transcript_56641/g.137598 Transcript_56641/m.137598 type:complete len:740 (+) Transcript_56641:310-2529(+)